MVVLVGVENPEAIFLQRAADGANVVLAGVGLLGIGLWIVEVVAGVQSAGAEKSAGAAVPLVRAGLRADDDGAAIRTGRVGIELCRANVEFADGFRRDVLQKSADEVVVVIAAVDGEVYV